MAPQSVSNLLILSQSLIAVAHKLSGFMLFPLEKGCESMKPEVTSFGILRIVTIPHRLISICIIYQTLKKKICLFAVFVSYGKRGEP